MTKKNYQFTILLISYIILIISSGFKFISFNEQYFLTMKLKGYYFTVGVMLFVVYASYKNDIKAKIIKIISIVLTLFGYAYSLYIVISNYNKVFTFDLGFYIYTISLMAFICSLFVPNGEDKNKKVIIQNNLEKENQNENYILGNLILGFKEIPFKSLVLLGTDESNNQLILSYKLDNHEKRVCLAYDSIVKVDYKVDPVIKYEDIKSTKYDNNEADYLITAFMLGGKPFAQSMAFAKLEEVPYEYKKANIETFYKVSITVILDGEERDIILNTVKNPEIFINKIKEKM